MGETVMPPAAPSIAGFPKEEQRRWEASWVKAFKQAQVDHPGDEITQRAVATREANRIFRVDEPGSHQEAMALEPWKVIKREVDGGGQLKVVTIEGKKYSFDVPATGAGEKPPKK